MGVRKEDVINALSNLASTTVEKNNSLDVLPYTQIMVNYFVIKQILKRRIEMFIFHTLRSYGLVTYG